MAVTVTNGLRTVLGNKRAVLSTVTFDSSYLSGGEPVTKAQLGLRNVDATFLNTTTGAVASYDPAAEIMHLFTLPALDGNARTTSQLGEVASTTDASAYVVSVLAIGT